MGIFFNGSLDGAGKKARRQAATFLLGIFSFAIVSTLVLAPQPSRAQYTDPVTSVQTTTTNVWTTIKDAFVEAAVTAVVNGVNYFATQMAYTLAVALTSDCPGQIVCWNSKAFEDGFKQAWQGAIGEAVGTLSEQGGFTALGFDLCNPGINFSLKIQLGMLDELKPPPPKCDFGALTSNWENFSESVSSGEVLSGLKPTFSKGESPLSVSLGVMDGLVDIKEEAKREDIMKRIMDASAGGGFSDIRDPVSGRVKSPASVTHQEFESMRKQQQEQGPDFSASAAAGQIASKAVTSIVINVVQTFAMTLVSRLLNKLVNGLLSTEELIAFQPDLILNPEGLLQPPGTSGLSESFAETRFSAAAPRDAGVTDPLLEFSVCPGTNRGPNNCVIDQQFSSAVRVADVTPLTVRDAIDKGMLHGDWGLIPSSNQIKDQDPFCYTYAYCESNLRKLRAARIIPIGWEIAAAKANANGTTKLKTVVDGFNDCNDDGEADSTHPWCHLIDPDWVLKAPPAQCRALAFGAVPLSSDIASRVEQCVDMQTCLRQDDNGACVGGWGYCARERNAWRFNGDSCPAAYNTCRTLRSRTGEVKNFVLNTIDHGVCNADNAGCRQYGINLSAVSCSRSTDCTSPSGCACARIMGGHCQGGADAGKACGADSECASGNCSTCVIAKDKTSCTSVDGVACRIPYPCSSSSGCSCDNSLSCTVSNGQRSCSSVTGGSGTGDDWQLDPSRFFNKNAQSCDATNNGCSALIRLQPGDSLNLIRNGSFEELEDGDNDGTPDHAKFWTPAAEVPNNQPSSLVRDGSKSVDGSNSVRLATTMEAGVCTSTSSCALDLGCPCVMTSGALTGYSCKIVKGQTSCPVTNLALQGGINVRRGTSYTVSFSLIPNSGNDVNGVVNMQFRDVNNLPALLGPTNVVSTTSVSGGTGTVTCGVNSGGISVVASGTKEADEIAIRAACTFVIDGVDVNTVNLWVGATSGVNFMDAVQLEEGGGTPFRNGYGGAEVSPIHVKVPPAYLGCTGSDGDRPECASFAGVCREEEVGCQAYFPSNGDPMIPGVAGPQDACPQECAGYDVFKQEESDFEAPKFPIYFIPSTARECTEIEVGCSEFTNVETEQVDYYSKLRLCLKPEDPSVSTFYSWEGSDTTGYQLRVWSFKHTTNGSGAVTSVDDGSPAAIAAGTASDICASDSCVDAGPAPCTRLDSGAVHCASRSIALPGGSLDGFCSRGDIDAGDLDCREFYDVNGNRHYRRLSKTIIASAACAQFRITVSSQVDCEKSNGRWDGSKGQCIYFADSAQSNKCTSEQNGCRAYKGNASSNIRSLVSDGFENGIGKWEDEAPGGASNAVISSESITVGGHSLNVKSPSGAQARIEVGGMVSPLRSYTLSFWARGSGTLETFFANGAAAVSCTLSEPCSFTAPDTCPCVTETGLSCQVNSGSSSCSIPAATGSEIPLSANATGGSLYFSDNSSSTTAPSLALTSDWKLYELGPVAVASPTGSQRPWGAYSVKLVFDPQNGTEAYVDNVSLKEVQDSIFVVRDSWQIPASCDRTPSGIPSPQEMLGCKEYMTGDAEKVYLRSFSRLCREKAVGCGAFSFTQNTVQNPYPQSFNAVCRLTEADNVTPRRCGINLCTLPGAGNCTNPAGCSCVRDGASCLVLNGAKTCDIPVPADSGASCVCNYNTQNPAFLTATAPAYLSDVCRVAIGDSECRFNHDAWDSSSRIDEHPDRINIPADQRMHLVVNRSNLCSSDQAGCRVMGKPTYTYEADCSLPLSGSSIVNGICTSSSGCTCTVPQGSTCSVKNGEKQCKVSFEHGVIDKWDAVALKDDPSRYEMALCSGVSLNCEEYTAADGTYYFKNPNDKVCEYKEGASYEGRRVNGFFRKSSSGTLFPCYPELLKNGDTYSMYKNADRACTLPNVSSATITNGKCTSDDGCQCFVAPNPTPVCRVFKGNTTCGYQGWVGQCEAKYDRCEEFIDPAHTSAANPEGEPYYYIMNAKLDLRSCAGKASLKQGCVLFKQTSKTQNIYSASATYYRSLSEANSGIVSPVNCDIDPRNPSCNLRCVSIPRGACSETPEKTCTQDTDDPRWGCPGATNRCQGKKQYGSGCSTAEAGNPNKDCNASIGEICAAVRTCSGSGLAFCDANSDCPVGQTCQNAPSDHLIPKAEGSVTRNDSNIIIKVRADRECAQWLACRTFETVFNAQEGKFKPRCTAFTLCEGAGAEGAVNQLECANPVEPPQKVLTEADYTNRDVTYSGLEYSGYSIPARYPAQYLSPVSVVTGKCFRSNGTGRSPYVACSETPECEAAAGAQVGDYCKQLSGICKYENVGRSCDSHSDCGTSGGFCSKSYFDTHRFGILLDPSYTCANDAACDGLDSCNPSQVNTALAATSAAGLPSCTKTKAVDDGRCLQHRCYYSYGGGPFNMLDSANRAQCRAYPEDDAPYGDTVLDTEQSLGIRGFDKRTYQAVSRKPGFNGANVCTFGNDCECSYKRLDYGRGATAVRFVGVSGGVMPESWANASGDTTLARSSTVAGQDRGVCSGGSRDGWTCRVPTNSSSPNDCKVSDDDVGSCVKLAKVSTVLGWPGFCMDLDKSINVNGSQDMFNCNLWLPVDQLAGAPDVFNQYREAGFKPEMDELLYCAVAWGNRKTANYNFVLQPGGSGIGSACIPGTSGGDAFCTGRGSQSACETGGSAPTNNVGGGWSTLGLGVTGKACFWDGSNCRNRVMVGGKDLRDGDSGDEPFSGFNASLNGIPLSSINACDKASAYASSHHCTAAAVGTFVLTGGLGAAALAGGGCVATLAAWCGDGGFKSCDGVLSSTGRFFHTSWQDSTVRFNPLDGNNWYKNQIVAAAFEMTDSTAGTVTSKMFLSPKNDWQGAFRWEGNCDSGLCEVNPKGYAEGAEGTDNTCVSLMNTHAAGNGNGEGTCEGIEDSNPSNCVGGRLEFNGSGKLMGVRSVLCHNDSTVWHKVDARLRIFFREACTDVIQAHNNGNDETPNFAWTDKLWDASNGGGPGVVGLPGSFPYSKTLTRTGVTLGEVKPFGPIWPAMSGTTHNGIATLPVRWPIPLYRTEGGSAFTALAIAGVQNPDHAPPCANNETADAHTSPVYQTYCTNGYTMVAGDRGPAENGAEIFPQAGQAYACDGACDAPDASGLGSTALDTAKARLANLFVQTFAHFKWNTSDQNLAPPVYRRESENAYDLRHIHITVNSAPKIAPPNTDNCDPGSEGLCEELGVSGIQVSGVTNSPYITGQPAQTANGGRAQVYLKYYAWADSNHMPIRRKIVDWGDKTFSETWGWFKNHRGCPSGTSPCRVADQICKGNDADWGRTLQACEPRYFQDVHTYTCTPQLVATLPACNPSDGDSKTYPCSSGGNCVFKPRVQFMDNWGQCNGTCPGGKTVGDSCFNASPDLNLTIPTTQPNSAPGRNECLKLDSGTLDNFNITVGSDPLKPYAEGPVIIVRPN